MSLIFSALAEIDKQAQGGQAAYSPMASPEPSSPARRGLMVLIVLLLVAVLALGAYVLLHGSTDLDMRAAPQPVVSATQLAPEVSQPTLVAPAAETAPVEHAPPYAQVEKPVEAAPAAGSMPIRIVSHESMPVAAEPIAQPGASQVVLAQNERIATLPPKKVDAPVPLREEPAPVGQARPALGLRNTPSPQEAVQVEPASPDDGSYIGSNNYIKVGKQPDVAVDEDIGQWVDTFRVAMANGDRSKAKAALAMLQAGLSPESLTLMRMQAWYAVDTGDDVSARTAYNHLLQRLPDDINAGVNVALIDWRAGHRAQALDRINVMYTQNPDSELVQRNWRTMHQQRQ